MSVHTRVLYECLCRGGGGGGGRARTCVCVSVGLGGGGEWVGDRKGRKRPTGRQTETEATIT